MHVSKPAIRRRRSCDGDCGIGRPHGPYRSGWVVIVGNDIEYFGTWDDAMLWVSNYLDKVRSWESVKGRMQEQRAKAGLPEEPILRPDAFVRMAMNEYMGRDE